MRLRADPRRIGLVTAQISYGDRVTYEVFFSGADVAQVNEEALENVDVQEILVLPRRNFLRELLLAKLDNPINDMFYAYQASRTQFEAYQFKPVLKFLDSPVPGILIADEVGLGKTIEAAILYEELKARGIIRRVLVICPAGLREKWQRELLMRFDEHFQIMRRKEIEDDIKLYRDSEGLAPLAGIVSLEGFRSANIQNAIRESGVSFDVVVIDEAHHLRTQGTLSNAVGQLMQDMAEHLILLTATPLQTGQQDLFSLLRFIDPEQYVSFSDFQLQLEPNVDLNAAIRALRQIPPDLPGARRAMTEVGDREAGGQVTSHPTYALVTRSLLKDELPRDELVRLRRDIDSLNILSAVYTRTKKGDVSRVARRKAFVVKVAVTPQEKAFIEAVLAHAREQAMLKSGWAPGFVGMMRERQAASSIAAMREYLDESLRIRISNRPSREPRARGELTGSSNRGRHGGRARSIHSPTRSSCPRCRHY